MPHSAARVFRVLLTLLLAAGGPAQAADRPNVLFVIVDDMNNDGTRQDDRLAHTPHLDAFRQQAVNFELAYCADNTLVVFWSDNGFHMGEKNRFEKGTPWERSAWTPLYIRLPEQGQPLNPGQVCPAPVSALDLYPTLVDLCGLEAPPPYPQRRQPKTLY